MNNASRLVQIWHVAKKQEGCTNPDCNGQGLVGPNRREAVVLGNTCEECKILLAISAGIPADDIAKFLGDRRETVRRDTLLDEINWRRAKRLRDEHLRGAWCGQAYCLHNT